MSPAATFGLFLGLLIGGETLLIPAVYASLQGFAPIPLIVSVSVIATLLSDSFWYLVGWHAPVSGRLSHIARRYESDIARMSRLFERYHLRLLIASKFMYGTRTVTQIVCGKLRVAYGWYLIGDLLGMLLWLGFLYLLGLILRESLALLQMSAFLFQIIFAVLFLLILIPVVWIMSQTLRNKFRS